MAAPITPTDYRAVQLQRMMHQAERRSQRKGTGATQRQKAANQYKRYRRQLVARGFCPDSPVVE